MSDNSRIVEDERKSKAMWAVAEREIGFVKEVEANKEIYSNFISSNSNYTNLIVVAGYAGYFSCLSMVKDGIPLAYLLLSILFMLISISFFVFFEVYKMVRTSSHINTVVNSLNNNRLASVIVEEIKKEQRKFNFSSMKYWYFCVCICLSTGLCGVFVLMAALGISFVRAFG